MQKWDQQIEQKDDFDLLDGLGQNNQMAEIKANNVQNDPEDVDKGGYDSFTDNINQN